jgi:hypothetical protein
MEGGRLHLQADCYDHWSFLFPTGPIGYYASVLMGMGSNLMKTMLGIHSNLTKTRLGIHSNLTKTRLGIHSNPMNSKNFLLYVEPELKTDCGICVHTMDASV